MLINDVSWADDREWLLTNGMGGYASSTLSGINTRKYHGLLVAGFSPEDRRVLLSRIEEIIRVKGDEYRLSPSQSDGSLPGSELYLKSFRHDVLPTFTYQLPGVVLEKTVFMPQGLNAVVVEYRPSKDVGLVADFLVTSRDHHWTLRDPKWDFDFRNEDGVVTLTPGHDNPPTIYIGCPGGGFLKPKERLRRLYYRKELERGYEHLEDVYVGARLEVGLKKGKSLFVACSADFADGMALGLCKGIMRAPDAFKKGEIKRSNDLIDTFYELSGLKKSESVSRLALASHDFVVEKGEVSAIIAGYPWFGEWGRDSLISLPGLCLSTDRIDDAERILVDLLEQCESGIIPNNFRCGKGLNSIDASLWYFWAVWKYLEKTQNYRFVSENLWGGMKRIIEVYFNMVDGGLIKTACDTPMTWMDAQVDGRPVTLRKGKAVEIEGLWFNALVSASKIAREFGDDPKAYLRASSECKKSFNREFWNPEKGYLFDVIDAGKDASVRPNALLAVSLPFPVLDKKRWKSVVRLARDELLTPYGLRTLSPKEPGYKGSGHGNQRERDLSYHQGDIWPWLFGPFVDAYKKVYPGADIEGLLRPLMEHNLWQAGIGCISEVFDGDPPHLPGGCINQAWSVAELLRALTGG